MGAALTVRKSSFTSSVFSKGSVIQQEKLFALVFHTWKTSCMLASATQAVTSCIRHSDEKPSWKWRKNPLVIVVVASCGAGYQRVWLSNQAICWNKYKTQSMPPDFVIVAVVKDKLVSSRQRRCLSSDLAWFLSVTRSSHRGWYPQGSPSFPFLMSFMCSEFYRLSTGKR